ncbi:MAG: hypothetical protein CML17_00810 [Pusillimonas sp.]|nr:hypothetical protein [Pusillimonas sp.]
MSFEVGELHPNTPHLFADLAELMLLVGYLGRRTLHKNDLESLLQTGAITPEEIDEEAIVEQIASANKLTTAERSNYLERQLEDVLTQLNYRAKALANYYPFKAADEQIELRAEFTNQQRIYIFLLACSRLRSFRKKGLPQKWAKYFAEISRLALRGLLPSNANARIFDANSEDRKNYYSTNLKHALKVLGRDLGADCDVKECEKVSTSGDAGLDLVGTIEFSDGAATNYAILGQCGAQETNWPSKTLEAHSIKFRHLFKVQFDYPSVMFTPVCFRSSTGEWVDNSSANGVLVADRGRILSLIDGQQKWDEIIGTNWFAQFEADFSSIEVD